MQDGGNLARPDLLALGPHDATDNHLQRHDLDAEQLRGS